MAEADAEAEFLSSMQAMNEGAGRYNNANGATGQQIDSSSSDEYDPAQDVQDLSMSSGPQYQFQANPVQNVDSSNNDFSRSVSASVQQPSVLVDGVNAKESHSNNLSLGTGADGTTDNEPPKPLSGADSPIINVQSNAVASLATTASTSDVGAATHEGSAAAESVPVKNGDVLLSHTTTAIPKARLPHDRIGLLEDRIKEDERGDMDAWLNLISEDRKRGKLEEAQKIYDRFFLIFPSAVSY